MNIILRILIRLLNKYVFIFLSKRIIKLLMIKIDLLNFIVFSKVLVV